MARLREVPFVVRKLGLVGFVKRVAKEVGEDGVTTMAAAVAFYWLLAIFPFILFLMAIPSLMPFQTRTNMKETVAEWAMTSLPPKTAATITSNVADAVDRPKGLWLLVGLSLTLWAASNGMDATMAALDRCYDVNKPRPYWVQRPLAVLITLTAGLILLVIALLLPIASAAMALLESHFTEYAPRWMSGPLLPVLDVARYCIGLTLVMLLISGLYQFGVAVRRRWTLITPGAVFCVLTILVLAWGFNLYLQKFGEASYAKTYGAIGGVIILLLLFYLYAVVFLIGAEINSEIDYEILGHHLGEEVDGGLPKLYGKEDLTKFRRQVEKRQAGRG